MMDSDVSAKQGPSVPELVAKAKELTPRLSANGKANEEAGRLVDDTVSALVDNGFNGMWMPACYGGAEAWPVEALEVIEALSYADGSTGWSFMAWQVAMASAAAYLPGETADELFSERFPIIAGQGGAIGRAEKVKGGYRLTGDWRYGSGLLHGEYTHSGANVYENGEVKLAPGTDRPEGRIFIVPIEEAELKGNWDVIGLRATGSIDYSMKDVFVPEEWTHLQIANRANRGGDVYRITIPGMGSVCHSGFALGTGRRVLDELATLALETPQFSGMIGERGGNDSFQEQFATAEAKFRSVRAYVREAQFAVQEAVQAGRDPTRREVTDARLALNIVTSMVAEICTVAYKYGGGVSIRDSVIQRCMRDMYGGTQHASTAPTILRECGKELMGMGEGKIWGPRGLIDPPEGRAAE